MIKVSGAFATRWGEEWAIASRMRRNDSHAAMQHRIELFLLAMGPAIVEVLTANKELVISKGGGEHK